MCRSHRSGAPSRLGTDYPARCSWARAPVPVPLDDDHRAKYAMHRRHIETTVVCSGATVHGDACRRCARHHSCPPVRPKASVHADASTRSPRIVALRAACGRRPAAVSCQSPYEAVGVLALRPLIPARFRPRVQIEVHGDWRTATRLYGSPTASPRLARRRSARGLGAPARGPRPGRERLARPAHAGSRVSRTDRPLHRVQRLPVVLRAAAVPARASPCSSRSWACSSATRRSTC